MSTTAAIARPTESVRDRTRLGSYAAPVTEEEREVVAVPGAGGSTLVIDRLARTLADARLIAHLAADEPPANARIMCEIYLADDTRGRCRRVTDHDLQLAPLAAAPLANDSPPSSDAPLLDAEGCAYCIRKVPLSDSWTELRWTRSLSNGEEGVCEKLTLRDVVGRLEAYEPARTITTALLAAHEEDDRVSTCRLRAELERLDDSPTVLNRLLREAIQRRVALGETLSEIAFRCGRFKRDHRGNITGETSWLSRRIGQKPEGGQDAPTPWTHYDVLALIARDGLGVSPCEVELR